MSLSLDIDAGLFSYGHDIDGWKRAKSLSFKYLKNLQKKMSGFKWFFPNYKKKNSIDMSDRPSLE